MRVDRAALFLPDSHPWRSGRFVVGSAGHPAHQLHLSPDILASRLSSAPTSTESLHITRPQQGITTLENP